MMPIQSLAEEPPMPPERRKNRRSNPPFLNYFLSSEATKPIGFVPRRKHQKSRRGCTTCKKRHIRCDEASPRCQNCTRHQSDCHYPEAHHEASGETTPIEDPASGAQAIENTEIGSTEDDNPDLEVIWPASKGPTSAPSSTKMNTRSLDPYSNSAAQMTAVRREQVAFYTDEIVFLAIPISEIRDAWNQSIIPLAFNEPMLLHILLSFASSHLRALRNVPLADCRELVYSNKTSAISLINRNLDNIQGATYISVVATILILLGQEIGQDHDASAVRAHVLGLRELIRLHGGFERIPSPLVKYIYIVDCAYAATYRCTPALPLDPHYQIPSRISKAIRSSEQHLSPWFLTQRYHSDLHISMLETYRNLSLVLSIQERAVEHTLASKSNTLPSEEAALYDTLRIPTLRSLLTFLTDDDNGDHPNSTSAIQFPSGLTPVQAICRVVVPIVALQDQVLPYRRAVYTVPMMDYLYKTLTSDVDLETCWATYAEVMLWATMFGVYISRGITTARDKELWFLDQLVHGVRGRKGHRGQLGGKWKWEWSSVREVLRRFYWSETFFGEEFKEICELLTPVITASDERTIERQIVAACSTAESTSQASPPYQYGELIRCFASNKYPGTTSGRL